MTFSKSPVLLAILGIPWLIDASVPPLPLSSHGIAFCISVSIGLFLLGDMSYWIKGPPYSFMNSS